MIDKARDATLLGGIHHGAVVNAEEVTAPYPALEIPLFTDLSDLLANHFADILNDHLVFSYINHSKEAPVMNGGSRELNGLLPLLKLVEAEQIRLLAVRLLLFGEVVRNASLSGAVRAR